MLYFTMLDARDETLLIQHVMILVYSSQVSSVAVSNA